MSASSLAWAEPTSAERSLAESLFQEGKQLMSDGKASEACPKLAESQRIDPGAGTLTALALCHRAEGKTASAYSEFRDVLSLARRDGRKDREQVAQENISELEPKLSRLKIIVEPAARAQNVEIRVDDLVYASAAFNESLPIDPGSRRIRVSAAGKKPFETIVTIGTERDEKNVTIRALEDDARAQAAMSDRAVGGSAGVGTGNTTQKYVGYGLAGLGVVALGVGTVFGLSAISKNKDSDSLCPSGSPCSNQAGVSASDDARSAATIANIAVIGGVAAIVGGLVLVLTSPSKPVTAALAPSTGNKPPSQRTGITGFGRSVVGLSGNF